MTKAMMGKETPARSEHWRRQMAEQERSGLSVRRFCEQQGLTQHSFYYWRKRLRVQQPMRFALVETGVGRQQPATEQLLELVLTTGERLRIGAGVDTATLRSVLEALRA